MEKETRRWDFGCWMTKMVSEIEGGEKKQSGDETMKHETNNNYVFSERDARKMSNL